MFAALATATLLVFVASAATLFISLRPYTLRVAVGSADSPEGRAMQELARTFARESAPLRLDLRPVQNPERGLELLFNKSVDIALARGDSFPDQGRALVILRRDVVVFWMREPRDKAVIALSEMKRARIGLFGDDNNIPLLQSILKASGLPANPADIVRVESNAGDSEHIDLFATVAPLKSKATGDLLLNTSRGKRPTFLSVDATEAIVRERPELESTPIPAGMFRGKPLSPPDEVTSIGTPVFLIATSQMSDEKAAAFARAVFDHRHRVMRDLPDTISLEKVNTEKDSPIPVHAGVAAYIDGTERTFFERYSDIFWGAILLLSGLGSAGAWTRTFFYRDKIDDSASARDELLEMIDKLNTENDPRLIADANRKVSRLLRKTLDRYEEGVLDEGALSAFHLAMEQYRFLASQLRAQR